MNESSMSDAERVLLEHRWAVQVNLPTHARHAGESARYLVDRAAYAGLPVPAEVLHTVEVLEEFALVVGRQVEAERAEVERRGVDRASFQRELEQAARLREEAGRE